MGLIGIGILFLLLAARMQVGLILALVGFLGYLYLTVPEGALRVMGTTPYSTGTIYTLSVVPLFILMGQFTFYGGLGEDAYYSTHQWLGHLPGGLAMATIAGCTGFAAVSGSSLATAATMGTVALPEMGRYSYSPKLSTGCIAAGGTLGILIPPSVVFIIYGWLTEQSVGELFIAGIFPGLLLSFLFMLTIYLLCRRNPQMGPRGPKTSLKEKLVALRNIWGLGVLFLLVIGGIYAGVFTPTEAGGIGAFGALVIALSKRRMTWQNFSNSLLETGRITATIFLIAVGAYIFGKFLTISRVPIEMASLASTLSVPPVVILIAILFLYMILGCFLDAIAMILITLPIFYPVILALGFDPIWFGVLLVLVVEMGLITPPVGMNVYVIAGVARDVPLYTVFAGILPFLLTMAVCIGILVAFPQISLFLPGLMG